MDESEAEGRPKGGGEAVRGNSFPRPLGVQGDGRDARSAIPHSPQKADAFAPAFCGE